MGLSVIWLIPQVAATASPPSVLSMLLTPTILWLLAGAVLCLMELFFPTAFVEFTMGLSAFAVALVSLTGLNMSLQIGLWMVLSLVLVVLSRRLLPNRKVPTIEDAKEAETLTEILPGQGRSGDL